jgi:hypothetical protein
VDIIIAAAVDVMLAIIIVATVAAMAAAMAADVAAAAAAVAADTVAAAAVAAAATSKPLRSRLPCRLRSPRSNENRVLNGALVFGDPELPC